MQCPGCECENEATARFCEGCGLRLLRRCPSCTREVSAAARFCPSCGAALEVAEPPPRPPPSRDVPASRDGERRQLTVMFCDLVGSTALSDALDAEDLRELVAGYQERCARVVGDLGGHIAQYLGDGILVYFGYPLAHEDNAARAVLAGLRIVDEIRVLSAEVSRRLEVRIGVHSGSAVVGEVGGGEHRERLALGDTPNIAARIHSRAPPGTLLVSRATHDLVRGFFESRPLGPCELPGIAQAIELHEVVSESGADSRFDVARRSGLFALVGRGEEVVALERRWQEAVSGSGNAVLVVGEVGIGKSRLVQALRDRIGAEAATEIEFRCSPHHIDTPLHPIVDYLERLLELRKVEDGEVKLARLESRIAELRTLPEDALPLLAALLQLPHPEGVPEIRLAPPLQKQRTLETMVAWLMEASLRQPVLNVWEDLHWADPSTLEFLGLLLERVPSGRTLSVLTYRPEFDPPWKDLPHLSRLAPARLEEGEVYEVAHEVARGVPLPEAVLRQIVDKTDGVPLLVEELTKTILDSSVVRRVGERYELSGPLDSLSIPATLRDILMARLDRMGPSKEIAQLGAVLGRDFPYELIEAISPLTGDELRKSLSVLVDAELLLQRSEAPRPEYVFTHYVFKHALIQEVAYESLLIRRRRRVHEQVARVLESRFAEIAKTRPELLAHHYTQAGVREEAVRCWLAAGQKSAQRSASLEAVNQLERGLAVLRGLPESPQRDLQELSIQVALGTPLVAVRGYSSPDVAQAFIRARELCEKLGDREQLFAVLFRLRSFALVHGEIEEALALGEELVSLAGEAGDAGLQVEGYYALGAARMYGGDLPGTLDAFTRMAEVYEPERHRAHAYVFGQEPGMALLAYQGWAKGFTGHYRTARDSMERAIAQADEVGHPFSQAFAWAFKTLFHWLYREPPETIAAARRTFEISQEYGFPFWIGMASPFLGWAEGTTGDPESGIAQIGQGIAAFRATGAELGVPNFLLLQAELHRAAGQIDEGMRAVEQGLLAVRRYGERYYTTAELYREKGELLRARGDGDPAADAEAERCYERALAVAREQGARWFELRALVSRARLRLSRGRGAEERASLARHLASLEVDDALADVRLARSLLAGS